MHRNLAVKVTEKLIRQTKDDETSQGNILRVATISALESQGQKVGLARWEPQRNSLGCQKCHLRSREWRMITGSFHLPVTLSPTSPSAAHWPHQQEASWQLIQRLGNTYSSNQLPSNQGKREEWIQKHIRTGLTHKFIPPFSNCDSPRWLPLISPPAWLVSPTSSYIITAKLVFLNYQWNYVIFLLQLFQSSITYW